MSWSTYGIPLFGVVLVLMSLFCCTMAGWNLARFKIGNRSGAGPDALTNLGIALVCLSAGLGLLLLP